MSDIFETPLELKLSSRERLCEIYAEKLHGVNPNHELLRFFLMPSNGDEWRAIRKEFFERFGNKEIFADNSIGYQALACFYGNFSVALRTECRKEGINVS